MNTNEFWLNPDIEELQLPAFSLATSPGAAGSYSSAIFGWQHKLDSPLLLHKHIVPRCIFLPWVPHGSHIRPQKSRGSSTPGGKKFHLDLRHGHQWMESLFRPRKKMCVCVYIYKSRNQYCLLSYFMIISSELC